MATALNRVTMQYRKSINTPEFENDPDWIINPDLSAVNGVPQKYWKLNSNDQVVEMNATEKAEVDQKMHRGILKVRKAMSFGRDLIAEFGGLNVDSNLSTATIKSILEELKPITEALLTGSLNVALYEIDNLQSQYISDDVKNYFKTKIISFLVQLQDLDE